MHHLKPIACIFFKIDYESKKMTDIGPPIRILISAQFFLKWAKRGLGSVIQSRVKKNIKIY